MGRSELQQLWGETLRSEFITPAKMEQLAHSIVHVHGSNDRSFRQRVKDRLKRIAESTGQNFEADNFGIEAAQAFIADEIGFSGWSELLDSVRSTSDRPYPILFQYAVAALRRGDFTNLDETMGGRAAFERLIRSWHEAGYFTDESETFAEAFAAACWLGHADAARVMLDNGVDPHAGMGTGLSGFHWAASSGQLAVVKMLIDRKVAMEVTNMYGGTVFGQAVWSAVNEHAPDHAAIVEELVGNGAIVDDGYLEWWNEQAVTDQDTKIRIGNVLQAQADFHARAESAKQAVVEAEAQPFKKVLADALKTLGNILRRPPFSRDAANEAFDRAADIYHELHLPLEEAWVKRHIGINYEHAGRPDDAERMYDEALALFREHSVEDTLDYANTVRYSAVIKNRLGKRNESTNHWEEALERYCKIGPEGLSEGVAEAAAWLTIFAIEAGDVDRAEKWFARASDAATRTADADTHKFIDEVSSRMSNI